MAIQAYELDSPFSSASHGFVLVNSVTDLPLPIPVFTFKSLDDADAFLEWLERLGVDPRRLSAEQAETKAVEWIRFGRDAQRQWFEERDSP